MKLVYSILLVVFLIPFVNAEIVELRNHEPVLINGVTFELSGRGEDVVYVEVGGKFSKVSMDEDYYDGVWMQLIEFNDPYDGNPLTATIAVTMDYECGNGICESEEDSSFCCTDCNCSEGNVCLENQCILDSLNLCKVNDDCNDNNACTYDNCSGIPLECYHSQVEVCESGDGCCPDSCNKSIDYINNDHDCLPEPECWTDFDCEDNDEDTIDLCDKRYKTCRFEMVVVGANPEINEVVEEEINETLTNSEFSEEVVETKTSYVLPIIIILIVFTIIFIKIFKNKENSNNLE